MNPRTVLQRLVGLSVRRPALVLAVVGLLTLAGAAMALRLNPDAGTDTLVPGSSSAAQASERHHARFGDDAVLILVRGDVGRLVLTRNLGALLELEGCLGGNLPPGTKPVGGPGSPGGRIAREKPVKAVYGPATFVNQSVTQIQQQLATGQARAKQQGTEAAAAARAEVAKRRGSRAEQARAGREAQQEVEQQFVQQTLQVALRYGLRSVPQGINDTGFVSQLVFNPDLRTPKDRFAYLFPNGNASLVQVRLRSDLTDRQRHEALETVRQAAAMPQFRLEGGLGYTVTGAPVVLDGLSTQIPQAIIALLIAVVLVMAATLLFVFGVRPRLAPLGIALAAAALTFGAMSALGVGLTMASVAVLPVLVGLAVDYAIQFQSRYAEARARAESSREAVLAAASVGGPTVGVAVLATLAGFLVLGLSPVPMVQGFGLLLVAGIAVAFVLSLTAGTAVLVLLGDRPPSRATRALGAAWRGAGELLGRRPARAIAAVAARGRRAGHAGLRVATAHPGRLLSVGLALAALGWVLDTQTRVVSDIPRLVPQDTGGVRDLTSLQRATGVAGEVDVTVEADDLTRPEIVSWMAGYQAALLKRYGYSAKRGCGRAPLCPGLSLPDLFREGTQGLDQGRIRALLDSVPPYFAGSVISADRRVASLSFGVGLMPLDEQQRIFDDMRARLDPPPGVRAGLAGLPVLVAEANAGVSSPWRRLLTLVAGLLAVGLVLLAVRRRADRALVPLLPIALATGWSSLVLFLLRIPLNPMSAVLGALVIAISTEFSVLLEARYRQERERGLEPGDALTATYRSTGAAVLASGATAVAGFAVLVVSDIRMLRDFGIVTVVDLSVSLVGVLLALPAVLLLAERGALQAGPTRLVRRLRGLRGRPRRRAPAT